MKNLNEYPTPITDKFCEHLSNSNRLVWDKWQLTASKCADFERKLAACRDLLACINSSQILPENLHAEIRETIKATAP